MKRKDTETQAKKDRLAKALKANLARRKAKARATPKPSKPPAD
ncbi:hypothetical protein [Aestuariivirga sp.]